MRLVSLILGFIIGVVVTRNAEPMSAPSTGAVFIGLALAVWIAWSQATRGKAEAVATAVAIAKSEATANASAVAQQAVYIMTAGVIPPNAMPEAVTIAGGNFSELPLKVAPALADTVVSEQATREGTSTHENSEDRQGQRSSSRGRVLLSRGRRG